MKADCPAKVNLRLRVFGADAAGFHAIETIFARTDLSDSLSIEEGGEGVSIEVDGDSAVPAGPDNLCVRAAEAFLAEAFAGRKAAPGLRIRLTKRIPVGAGLGGGSADAGATLRLLAERWPRLETRALFRIAGELGSDVPFALLDVPMALGWERGRRLLPLRPPRPRAGLLACPPFGVSTPEAYAWLDEGRGGESGRRADPGGTSVLPGATRLASWESLEGLVTNDLEPAVFARHPELARAASLLRETAGVASMTGSGSAVFAAFAEARARDAAARALEDAGHGASAGWKIHDIRLPV